MILISIDLSRSIHVSYEKGFFQLYETTELSQPRHSMKFLVFYAIHLYM